MLHATTTRCPAPRSYQVSEVRLLTETGAAWNAMESISQCHGMPQNPPAPALGPSTSREPPPPSEHPRSPSKCCLEDKYHIDTEPRTHETSSCSFPFRNTETPRNTEALMKVVAVGALNLQNREAFPIAFRYDLLGVSPLVCLH